MNRLKNGWNHFRTITEHKWVVMQGCFKVGLYRQGLMHDLSKYRIRVLTGLAAS